MNAEKIPTADEAQSVRILMRLPAVREACGLSRATIYQWIRDGRFPAPVKLGSHISVWDSLAISAWIKARCMGEEGSNEK